MPHLQLFPAEPFLENKLGKEAFEKIPRQPGIYRLYDADNTLLYVGKAKNLRKRLFSYKRASAGKTTRKEAALIRRIDRFEFDVLSSETDAFLHENRWIRNYRPEFNHQNKHIETYYYIILYLTNRGLGLEYSMTPAVPLIPGNDSVERLPTFNQIGFRVKSARLFGCFKGHRSVRIHLGYLIRLIWLTMNHTMHPYNLPSRLSRNLAPRRYFFDTEMHQQSQSEKIYSYITEWFTGRSPDLVYYLIQRLPEKKSRFQKEFLCSVTDYLLSYFDRTLAAHCNLIGEKEENGNHGLIFQDELDDFYLLYKTD